MTNVLDSSAVLAVLQGEHGAAGVLPLLSGAVISSVNVAEVLRVLLRAGLTPTDAQRAFTRLQLSVAPFEETQAAIAAEMGAQHQALSLGDCACLALTKAQASGQAVTADRAWKQMSTGVRVTVIR